MQTEYDAIVVGAGPNGLAAALTLQEEGLSVLLMEGADKVGGGTRSEALTLPGFVHDVCAAVHPMLGLSPFLKTLPLGQYGLEMIEPPLAAAHPLDRGRAAVLDRSIDGTAAMLGIDGHAYRSLLEPIVRDLPSLLPELLRAFPRPIHPLSLAAFGVKALPPATWTARRFQTSEGRALWAGMAAHGIQPLSNFITSAIGLLLMAAGHSGGWPIARGGSGSISAAMLAYFQSRGGKVQTGFYVRSLRDLPSAKAVLFDVTPRQLVAIAESELGKMYTARLIRYRYGMGVFKIDWALSDPIPFTAEPCRQAGTLHLGGTFEEIAHAEAETSRGKCVERPFVLVSQPSLFDPTRAPEGQHTAWAYCHVPHGSDSDRTLAIEQQVERFAPGFRQTILARHTFNARQMEQYNPNYVGGDINGGVQDIFQHFSRPILSVSPYRTPARGIYLCSSATPPGGGVHGMCGYHAARRAIKDRVFG